LRPLNPYSCNRSSVNLPEIGLEMTNNNTSNNENPKEVPSIESLKATVDETRKQLDGLTSHGNSPLAESLCIARIQALLKQIKELHGVNY
jgi:hypothetical protein